MPVLPPVAVVEHRLPDLYRYLPLPFRTEGDPDQILRAWFGDGEWTRSGWTLTEAGGFWGLLNAAMEAVYWGKIGVLRDPARCPPQSVDAIARDRGLPQALIDAVRESAATDDAAELLVRKLAAAAPLIWRWKSTLDGGGDGGILRALRILAYWSAGIRETFWWRRFVPVAATDPARPTVARGLTVAADSYTADLYVVDWPASTYTTEDALAEMIRADLAALEVVHLRRVRWYDAFLTAKETTFGWLTSLQTGDTWVGVPPDPFRRPPHADPWAPGGYGRLKCGAVAGDRYLRPATTDASRYSGITSHEHEIEAIFTIEEAATGSRKLTIDANWISATDAAYRVVVSEAGVVQLYADSGAAPTTLRATASGVFASGLPNADKVRVVVTVVPDVGLTSKTVTVAVNDHVVLTWTDAATTTISGIAGTFRIGWKNPSSTLRLYHVGWAAPGNSPRIITTGTATLAAQ